MRKLLLILAIFGLLGGVVLTSCNVTRIVTNESQYFKRGDTTIVIQTKTTESYDATKRF